MITVRHMERMWNGRRYVQLIQELMAPRMEVCIEADLVAGRPVSAAAAMALIRLEELNQSRTPLSSILIQALVASQDQDGGWGEALTTALCVKALSLNEGAGEAIDRGLGYLASMQQPSGIWPRVPLRRMPSDACISAFVLLQLGDDARFRQAVDFDAAVEWFQSHELSDEPAARRIWSLARIRCVQTVTLFDPQPSWS